MSSQPTLPRESGDYANTPEARTYGVHTGSLEPIAPTPVAEIWRMMDLKFSRKTSETEAHGTGPRMSP